MCIFNKIFKRQHTTLVAKTNKYGLVDLFPIVYAKDFQPSWTKDFASTYEITNQCPVKNSITNRSSTISSCHGVRNLLDKGFLLRAWEDMSIVIYPNGSASFAGAGSKDAGAEAHDKRQIPDCFGNKVVVKLKSPWHFFCDNTQFLFIPPVYHNNLRSQGVADVMAVVDYKVNNTTNVFIIAEPKNEPYEIFIKAGTPLAQIIPLTDKKINLKNEYSEDYKTMNAPSFFFLRGYARLVKTIGQNK